MVFEKLKYIIAEQVEVDEDKITLESSFVEDLGADELDLVELVMAIEEDFNIFIPDDEWSKLKTVGDVVSYIEGKI